MRALAATDLFRAARVVNTMGIKDDIKKIALTADSMTDIIDKKEEIGFELLFGIFEKATSEKGENELYKFLSDIFEMSVEEVSKMDPIEFIDTIFEVANLEKWKAFFSRLAKLTQ